MACCMMAPSHYMKQCWLLTTKAPHSPQSNFITIPSAFIYWQTGATLMNKLTLQEAPKLRAMMVPFLRVNYQYIQVFFFTLYVFVYCLLDSLYWLTTSNFNVIGPLWSESTGFSSHRTSNAETVTMPYPRHVFGWHKSTTKHNKPQILYVYMYIYIYM